MLGTVYVHSYQMNFFEIDEGISKDQSFVNIQGAKFNIPKQLEESKGNKNFFGIRPENLTLNNNEGLKGSVFGVEYLGSRKIITVKTSFFSATRIIHHVLVAIFNISYHFY